MNRKVFRLVCCMALMTMGVTVGTIHAADEDTAASVYLVFDPETGEFQTSEDLNRNSLHRSQQEAIDSVTPADVVSSPAVTETFGWWSPKVVGGIILGVLVLLSAGYIRVRQRTRAS